jgi:hypothetical protein
LWRAFFERRENGLREARILYRGAGAVPNSEAVKVPGLQRTAFALRYARDTMLQTTLKLCRQRRGGPIGRNRLCRRGAAALARLRVLILHR